MSNATTVLKTFDERDLPGNVTRDELAANRFTEATLRRHKREGMALAVRARWVALAVVAVMLPFLNPSWDMLYYEALLAGLVGVGILQRRVGRVGRSRVKFLVMAVELIIIAVMLGVPNPFSTQDWPTAMNFRFEGFSYFYIILAAGTLTYSWRTITAIGNLTAALWALVVAGVWWFGQTDPALTDAAQRAFSVAPDMLPLLDPNSINLDLRAQEVVVFLIVAFTLALTVRRFNRLLLGNAELERERENLSRYFSPNVVEELSRTDASLKITRTHDAAVLFVDIVGFTSYCAKRDPQGVIATLRAFHSRMETEVFRHGGTLDKYLGDGLMATFGTPLPTERDAINALQCARAMQNNLAVWNSERIARGETQIVGSFGAHYGPVVLGDIGANRLEFAVIGNTVNVANRLEKLSRDLNAEIVLSEHLVARARAQAGTDMADIDVLEEKPAQVVRGVDVPIRVWCLDRVQ